MLRHCTAAAAERKRPTTAVGWMFVVASLFAAAAGSLAHAQGEPRAAAKPQPNPSSAGGENDATLGKGPAAHIAASGEEIVITATRRPEHIAAVPSSVSIISGEELRLQARASQNLAEALGILVPGLALNNQGLSTFGQTLRGRQVLVLIDGVPQSAIRNVSRDIYTISPAMVERVEVIRGATAMYGEGAAGGVINIVTRALSADDRRFHSAAIVSASPARAVDSAAITLSQTALARYRSLEYAVSGSMIQTTGFFDGQGDQIPPDPHGQGGHADTFGWDLFAKAGAALSAEQRLVVTGNYLRNLQNSLFTSDPAVNAAEPGAAKAKARQGLELDSKPEVRNALVSVVYEHDDALASQVTGQLYYRSMLTRFSPFDGRMFANLGTIFQSRLDSEKAGGRLQAGTSLPHGLDALWGVDASWERSAQPVSIMDPEVFDRSGGTSFRAVDDRTWVPEMQVTALALFSQLEWRPHPMLRPRAGLRYEFLGLGVADYTTLTGHRIAGGKLDFQRAVFNAGVVFAPAPALSSYVNLSQGYSLPDVGLILRNAPEGASVATLNTAPQQVDLAEAGLRLAGNGAGGSVAVFYSRSDLGTSSGGFSAPVVRAPERVYGVEASLDWHVLARWDLQGTVTWNEGELDKDGDGNYEPLNNYRIPPVKLTGAAVYRPRAGWQARVQVIHSGRRDRFSASQGFGERPVERYTTVDFMGGLPVWGGEMQLGISNLLDRHYFTRESQLLRTGMNTSYAAAPGLIASLGYRVSY